MSSLRIWFLSSLLLGCLTYNALQAQTLTVSPYSRYAIGDIFNGATARNAAMGGIGIASDNYFSLNFLNPAGYADLIFTTMDVAAFGQLTQVNTATQDANQFTGGFQNLAFGFPPNKGPKLAFGFTPYSTVGYDVLDRRNRFLQDTIFTQETNYRGEGGLNQLFIGTGGALFKKKLRLGANAFFRFGNTRYEWENRLLQGDSLTATTPIFQGNSVTEDLYVTAFATQLGLIYQDTLNRTKQILMRVGGTAEFTLSSSADRFTVFNNGFVEDSLSGREFGDIVFPAKFGGGLTINRPGYWSVGADFTYQDWSQFSAFDEPGGLNSEWRAAIGGEFAPDPQAFKYLKRTKYRAGAYYQQSYLQFTDEPVLDYGVTLGIGLPSGLKGNNRFNRGRAASRINIAVELGRRGNNTTLPLQELYARFRLGVNINDTWFIKRVVD
ncbi:MAG: hypothetical protein AAF804_14100 [Bacteroidota bacterium]